MYCENCGKALNENDKFCNACGKRVNRSEASISATEAVCENTNVQAVAVNTEMTESVIAVTEVIPESKPRKKWRRPVIIAALLVIFSSLIVYAAPVIKNMAQKLYYSPEEYFKVVVKREIKDFTDELGSAFSDIPELSPYFGDLRGESEITLQIGDELYNLLEAADVEELDEIKDSIGWIKKISLSGESGNVGTDFSGEIEASVNGKKVVTINVATDDSGIYLQIPEINNKTIKIETDSLYTDSGILEDNPFYIYKEIMELEQVQTFREIAELIPDEKAMQKLLYKYICSMIDQVDSVFEDTQKLKVGDIKQNCTKLTVSVNEELLTKMLTELLKEVKSDDDIKNIIRSFCNLDEVNADFESSYSEMISGIDEIISEMEETETSKEELFQFNVWVNNVGDLVGFGVGKDGVSFSAMSLESGKNYASAIRVEAGIVNSVSLEGSGKISGNKTSGTFYVIAAGNKLAKIVTEYDNKKAGDGIFDGKVSLELTDFVKEQIKNMSMADLGELADLKVTVDSKTKSKKSEDFTLALMKGSGLCASLNIKSEIYDSPKKINIPDNYVSVSDEWDMLDWLSGLKLNVLSRNLKSAGAPKEITDAITEADAQLQFALQPEAEVLPDGAVYEDNLANLY